jgi:hypothetical protein
VSYSRWSNSIWYTYYACSYSYERDEQAFDVCGARCFYYGELKENLEGCITEVKKLCPESTEEEVQELKGYISEFIDDVEHDIALNLVQDIKRTKLKDLPELYQKLVTQTEKIYDKDVYQELLEDIRKILYDPTMEKSYLKTDIGRHFFDKKLLIPKNTRFKILKQDI